MNLEYLIKNYTTYNLWANTKYTEWLKPKPPELLEQKIPSSFPGIKETLLHIWDTERFWLSVLQGNLPRPSFRFGFDGTTGDVFSGIVNESQDFLNFINSLDEKGLKEECNLDTPWVKGALPRFEFVQHCMNHSAYHRGQIVTIAHHLGIKDAPMTDYNFFNMMVKAQM